MNGDLRRWFSSFLRIFPAAALRAPPRRPCAALARRSAGVRRLYREQTQESLYFEQSSSTM